MFIFFGTKDRQEQRGIVAEHCPRCSGIRPFRVVAHYHVGHIYYLSLGRGTYSGSSMACVDCGTEFGFDEGRYAEVLSPAHASAASFEELVRRSNPDLARSVAAGVAAGPAVERPGGEPELKPCPTCGHPRDMRYRFCPSCGRPEPT